MFPSGKSFIYIINLLSYSSLPMYAQFIKEYVVLQIIMTFSTLWMTFSVSATDSALVSFLMLSHKIV